MDLEKMSKDQLIEKINDLKKQIADLKAMEAGHKKVEAALRMSEENFRFFFNAAPIGLSITNTYGEVLNANKTILDLLGYSLEEYMTVNIMETYADHDERRQLLEMLQESNRVRNYEAKLKHKDGSVFSVLMNSDYIELDGKRVLLTSIHDITLFKKVQEELKESEARYNILFSNAPIGITVTDVRGNLTAANHAIQELLGYTDDELKGKNVGDFYFDKEDRHRLLILTERSPIVRDFETKFIHKDGRIITVLINTDLVEINDQHDMLLTSIRDVSNYKQVEDDLKKERDFTNAILDVAASLILVLDKDGLISRFNYACEKTTGYSFDEVVGCHTWDFLSLDAERSKEHESIEASDYPNKHENIWRTKDGGERLISWSNAALLNQNGDVEYIIATGIDITERKQAEIELKEANQKLLFGIKELEERSLEMSRLSELGDQLQSCQNMDEACAISAQYIRMLCPHSQGALYIIHPSKDLAEAVEMWGDDDSTTKLFMPLDCWAIRRGRPHLVDPFHPGLLCKHISGTENGQYLCIPMMAHGEVMGILHLNNTNISPDQKVLYNEHKIQMVMTLSEHIALALSNLRLRETMRQQSIRDPLTGLYNRRYMEESLSRELHRAERENKPVGVIMFDIDHFKDFNDLFGHDGGDALLRELGDYLKTKPGAMILFAAMAVKNL